MGRATVDIGCLVLYGDQKPRNTPRAHVTTCQVLKTHHVHEFCRSWAILSCCIFTCCSTYITFCHREIVSEIHTHHGNHYHHLLETFHPASLLCFRVDRLRVDCLRVRIPMQVYSEKQRYWKKYCVVHCQEWQCFERKCERAGP